MRRVFFASISVVLLFGVLIVIFLANATCLFGHEYRNDVCKRCHRVRPDTIGVEYGGISRGDGTHSFSGTVYNGLNHAVDCLELEVVLLDGPAVVKRQTVQVTGPGKHDGPEMLNAWDSMEYEITVKTRGISFDAFRVGVAGWRD